MTIKKIKLTVNLLLIAFLSIVVNITVFDNNVFDNIVTIEEDRFENFENHIDSYIFHDFLFSKGSGGCGNVDFNTSKTTISSKNILVNLPFLFCTDTQNTKPNQFLNNNLAKYILFGNLKLCF